MSLFSTCYQGRLNSCITRRSSCRAPASQVIFRAGVYNPVISLPSPQVLCSPSLAGIETLPVLFSIPPPPLPNKHSFSVSPFYQASSLQCPGDLLAVPPCSEPCPLPPPPAFRVLCDCFLPSILIFTHLPWSPDQPFSSHQAAGLSFCLSSGVFCLPFTFSPCALPVHTLFQFLAVFFSCIAIPLSISSLPVGPPSPGRHLYFRMLESVRRRRQLPQDCCGFKDLLSCSWLCVCSR